MKGIHYLHLFSAGPATKSVDTIALARGIVDAFTKSLLPSAPGNTKETDVPDCNKEKNKKKSGKKQLRRNFESNSFSNNDGQFLVNGKPTFGSKRSLRRKIGPANDAAPSDDAKIIVNGKYIDFNNLSIGGPPVKRKKSNKKAKKSKKSKKSKFSHISLKPFTQWYLFTFRSEQETRFRRSQTL